MKPGPNDVVLSPEFSTWVQHFLALSAELAEGAYALLFDGSGKTICSEAPRHYRDTPCSRCDHRSECPVWPWRETSTFPSRRPARVSGLASSAREVGFAIVEFALIGPGATVKANTRAENLRDFLLDTWLERTALEDELANNWLLSTSLEDVARLSSRQDSVDSSFEKLSVHLRSHFGIQEWAVCVVNGQDELQFLPEDSEPPARIRKEILGQLESSRELMLGDFYSVAPGDRAHALLWPFLSPRTGHQQSGKTGAVTVFPLLLETEPTDGHIRRARILLASVPTDMHADSESFSRIRILAQLALMAWEDSRRLKSIGESVRHIPGFERLIGECKAMDEVRLDILRVAESDRTVLLVGEQGTGKEVVARLIHERSAMGRLDSICSRVAEELRIVEKRARSHYPPKTSLKDIVATEFRQIPGVELHSMSGGGNDWLPDEDQHQSAILGEEELLPRKLRPIFRTVVKAIYEAWHDDRLFNFFEFDSGAASTENIAAELFGVPEERYTGVKGGPGRFQSASHCGGTLFLDNVHYLPASVQSALLKATEVTHEERRVTRAGSSSWEPIYVRIIASSTRELASLVSEEKFLGELASRLMTEVIRIPSLRERPDDIPALALYFAQLHGKLINEDAIEFLGTSDWRDSNVRGLRTVVENAASRTSVTTISRDEVVAAFSMRFPEADGVRSMNKEERMIRETLSATKGNVAMAARRIGWNRQKLYRRMKVYSVTSKGEAN